MGLTRHLRSLLAGPRRGAASVLTVMFLVLAVVSAHVLCSVQLDGETHSGAQAPDGGGQLAVYDVASAHDAVVEVVPEPLGGDSHGCSDHHPVTTRCDPVLPPPLVLAVMPERTVQRLAPAVVHQDHRAASSAATAAAPSLHALGISRT